MSLEARNTPERLKLIADSIVYEAECCAFCYNTKLDTTQKHVVCTVYHVDVNPLDCCKSFILAV